MQMKSVYLRSLPVIVILMLMTGCGNMANPEQPIDLEPVNAVPCELPRLPPNFTISDGIAIAAIPESAAQYIGCAIEPDQGKLEAALKAQWPDVDYRIRIKEHGFSITDSSSDLWRIIPNLARVIPGKNTLTRTFNGAMNNNDFTAWGDLPGLPALQEVLDELENVFFSSGLGQFRAVEAYAMESSVLSEHNALWVEEQNNALQEGETPVSVRPWEENDSCYLILFESLLDGIPLYTKSFHIERDIVGPCYAYALVGMDGLLELSGDNLYYVGDQLSLNRPLSMEESLDRFLQDMQTLYHTEGTELTSVEFCYLPVPEGKKKTTLHPVWAFEVSRPLITEENSHNDPTAIDKYLYDAISGEPIQGR